MNKPFILVALVLLLEDVGALVGFPVNQEPNHAEKPLYY